MTFNPKILITTDVSGDINDYTINLVEIITSLTEAEVILVSTKNNKEIVHNKKDGKVITVFSDVSIDWDGDFNNFKKNINSFKQDVIKQIEEHKPDIIHLNHYIDLEKDNYPTILTAHEDVLNKMKWTKKRGRNYFLDNHLLKYREYIKNQLKKPDCIVTLSRFNAQNLLRTYDLSNKVKIIYNGINSKFNEKDTNNTSLITCINTDKEAGNFSMFLKTVHKLPENVDINVIDQGIARKDNQERINYFSQPNEEEIKKLCSNSDIYIDLSNWDTFGIMPITAAFSKCAILANDIPFLRELWGDCACMFERNNVYSLLRNMNNLIENKQYLDMVSQKCYNKAISVFNSKRMGYEYINLYKHFLR